MDFDSTTYTVADGPELAKRLIAAHSATGNPTVERELGRFLWNRDSFSWAMPFAEGAKVIAAGQCSNFVYDKKARMLFLDCPAGMHQILMFYLEGLHQTDMNQDLPNWYETLAVGHNSTSRLADAFVERGHGLFLSSVSKQKITVSETFPWDDEERAVFEKFGRDVI